MGKDAPDELQTQYFANLAKKERQDAIGLLRAESDVRLAYWAGIVRTLDAASLQAMFGSDKQALFSGLGLTSAEQPCPLGARFQTHAFPL